MTIRPTERPAAPPQAHEPGSPTLWAYEVGETRGMELRPAPKERAWMEAMDDGFPNRCLPLTLANQSGWIVPSPTRFTVRWKGGDRIGDTRLWFPRGVREGRVLSHFGGGIVTFTLPYLFRTPPGINLWVKGPSNQPKDGIHPLEGIVESDWTEATFTMNWKVTRPDHAIRFEEGEPICMIVPVPRGLLEELVPKQAPLAVDPELEDRHAAWSDSREAFNAALARRDTEAERAGWQRHYMRGTDIEGQTFDQHQTRLRLRGFTPIDPPDGG